MLSEQCIVHNSVGSRLRLNPLYNNLKIYFYFANYITPPAGKQFFTWLTNKKILGSEMMSNILAKFAASVIGMYFTTPVFKFQKVSLFSHRFASELTLELKTITTNINIQNIERQRFPDWSYQC